MLPKKGCLYVLTLQCAHCRSWTATAGVLALSPLLHRPTSHKCCCEMPRGFLYFLRNHLATTSMGSLRLSSNIYSPKYKLFLPRKKISGFFIKTATERSDDDCSLVLFSSFPLVAPTVCFLSGAPWNRQILLLFPACKFILNLGK